MTTSRRDFLRSTGLAAAGLTVFPSFSDAALRGDASPPAVRGLLFGEADLPRMRDALRQPHIAPFWESLLKSDLGADMTFLKQGVRYNNHVKDLLQTRQILERTSFVYALTGDRVQGDVALAAVNVVMHYAKWDYFLEGGEDVIGLQRAPEATIAMACAREWLAPILPPATATEMEKQIAEKGAPACYRTLYGMKYPDRVRGWGFDPESDYAYRFNLSRWPLILNATNLKVIPIAALGMAGCLLLGKHPQAQRWIDLAVESARAFSVMFGPDGSYDEGAGYWGYTATHLTMLVEVVGRRTGMDLRSLINFPGTALYGLHMGMAVNGRPNDCVNFSDAGSMGEVAVAAWTAGKFKDPIAQYVATRVGEVRSHYPIIWFDPTVPVRVPGADLLDVRLSNDWVVARSGWGMDDGVVALRSGGPSNHEHADRNSVIFKAYGERLFHDPYHAAYSYTDPHWSLRLTLSHTALLIDGKGHQYHDGHEGTNSSWAEARVTAYRSTPAALVVTSDATAAYRLILRDVTLVRRTVVFLKPDVLLLFDEVRLAEKPLPVQVRFQVDNSDGKGSVAAGSSTFQVTRPLATLKASVLGNAALEVRTGRLGVPEEHGIHPFAEAEAAAATDHAILTVCTAQKSGSSHGALRAAREGKDWVVEGRHNGADIAVRIRPGQDGPEVTVSRG
jgi:hypothetical protein